MQNKILLFEYNGPNFYLKTHAIGQSKKKKNHSKS